MDELRDASVLLMDAAGPWLRTALESAVDALPAAVQCQGVEGLHALAALPQTLEMATAEEYSAALYDAGTATIAAGTSWMQLLSLLGRPCVRLLHVITLAIAPTARDAALHLGREAWAAAVLMGREAWARPQLIAAAAAVLVALLLAWRLVAWLGSRRYIARASAALGRGRSAVRRRYESFLQDTRRRSHWLGWVLATSLPHAGYVLGCVAAPNPKPSPDPSPSPSPYPNQVSLGSAAAFEFAAEGRGGGRGAQPQPLCTLVLPPRGLLVFSGDAYEHCLHQVPAVRFYPGQQHWP